MFLDEAHRQATAGLRAHDRLNELLATYRRLSALQPDDWWLTRFFDEAQLVVVCADIVNSILYDGSKDRQARSRALRRAIGVDDKSPLNEVVVRGALVHIDKVMDAWQRKNPDADSYHELAFIDGPWPVDGPVYAEPVLRGYHVPSGTFTVFTTHLVLNTVASELATVRSAITNYFERQRMQS
jgi:hypothetical protein